MQPVPEQLSRNLKLAKFCEFWKTPRKDRTPRKDQTPDQREFKTTEMRKAEGFLSPGQHPLINWAWCYGIFASASLGYLSGYTPSQLLYAYSLAGHGSQEKLFEFSAKTDNISVINILLVLNPKHSTYWEENWLYPSRNQDTNEYLSLAKEAVALKMWKHCLCSAVETKHSQIWLDSSYKITAAIQYIFL